MEDLQHQISVRTSARLDQKKTEPGKGTKPLEFGFRCNFPTEILFLGRIYLILMDVSVQD